MSQHDSNKPPTVRVDPRILLPMAGILFAPFIGFMLSPNLGLGILVVCLGITGWMTWNIAEQAPAPQARTLKMGAIMNMGMAVVAAVLLFLRL